MGIQGLLQFLKDATEPIHVKKYRGQTVAVDTYCWLHKGAFSCAEKLAKGEPTEQYVWYCMKFVDMLLSFGVKPILVFDGCNLPSKREVDKARRERRQANLQKGKQLLREGKTSEARDCFTKSVSVTPSMAHDVIKAARSKGVDCIVAPYEADAQLAYLSKSGMAQAIITEDSDLLAFGCKKVILKMDKEGNGLEIDQNNLGRCRSLGDVFTEEKFRHMCILSGCDYLASLYGIGLGKACKLLKMANNPDILRVIKKMGQYLKMNLEVPEEYIEGFVKAENTFLYQLIFDPVRRKVVPLNPYPEQIDPASLSYAGHNVGDEKGFQMALGNLDIHTMEIIDHYNPDKLNAQTTKPRSQSWNNRPEPSAQRSMWSRDYIPGLAATTLPAPSTPKTPPSTRGKERVITLQGLKLPSRDRQAKRPREDSSLSDQDVLQQYSASSQKRVSTQEQTTTKDTPTLSTRPSDACTPGTGQAKPKPRNCFATLLQRRNQDAEGDGQVTRSRFFSNSREVISQNTTAQEELSQDVAGRPLSQDDKTTSRRDGEDLQGDEDDAPDVPSVDTPSPPPTPTLPSPSASPSPKRASQGVGVFRWSGTSTEQSRTPVPVSGLAALQQFHRQKPDQKPPLAPSPPAQCPVDLHPEDRDTPPDSPPSQDSAYFSQPGPTSCHKEEVLAYSFSSVMMPTPSTDAIFEISSCKESDSDQSPTNCSGEDHKPSLMKAKVPGLPRLNRSDQGKATKIRPSGTARASGLRKKPSGPGKKTQSNDENNPGLQSTITSLWKNFGFKRENPRMNPREKAEPLSPVKDNLLALTPEKEKDVYFVSSTNKIKCL